MNFWVCAKHVPDTETRVKVSADGMNLEFPEANYVINPYDEYAVEEALRLKEKLDGEVTVVTLGGDDSTKTLRQALAMGADKGILLSDEAFEGGDALSTARALAAAIKGNPFDIVFCGKHAVGDDDQQVGTILAELLGVPSISVVTSLELEGDSVTCLREIEGGSEQVKAPLPCVITCQKGLCEPRYPSLRNIMQAKKKPVDTLSAADAGLDASTVGAGAGAFELKRYSSPPSRPEGRILEGEIPDQVKELVGLLQNEAKVI